MELSSGAHPGEDSRKRLACCNCRTSKIRCLPSSPRSSPAAACQRCLKFHLHCEYKPKRRPGRQQRASDNHTMVSVPSHRSQTSSTSTSVTAPQHPPRTARIPEYSRADTFSASPLPIQWSSPGAAAKTSTDLLSMLAQLRYGLDAVYHQPVDADAHSIETKQEQLNLLSHLWNPVPSGLLSEEEVTMLYTKFMSQHNCYIALLDPVLHTPHYVLSTSPTLHLTILTVSARCNLPDRYANLLAMTNTLLGEAFATGRVQIGICQAISLLSTWKHERDSSNFSRLGYAIRLAMDLNLDQRPIRPLPEDRTKAREILNGERTWIQLFSFDRTLLHLYGKPRMLSSKDIWDIHAWAMDHPDHYCGSDGMLAASQESGLITHDIKVYHLRPFQMAEVRDSFCNDIKGRQTLWEQVWHSQRDPVLLATPTRLILDYYKLNVRFVIADFELQVGGRSAYGNGLLRAMDAAMDVLHNIIYFLAPAEILTFAPEMITLPVAKIGIFLSSNHTSMDRNVSKRIVELFSGLQEVCERSSRGRDTAYYQAQFFASLIEYMVGSAWEPVSFESNIPMLDDEAILTSLNMPVDVLEQVRLWFSNDS